MRGVTSTLIFAVQILFLLFNLMLLRFEKLEQGDVLMLLLVVMRVWNETKGARFVQRRWQGGFRSRTLLVDRGRLGGRARRTPRVANEEKRTGRRIGIAARGNERIDRTTFGLLRRGQRAAAMYCSKRVRDDRRRRQGEQRRN